LNSIRFVGIGIAALLSAEPLAAQTAVCSLSDPNYQYCLYHGVGRQLGYEPSNTTELSATANWDQPNDGDLHGLLPQTETYSDPLIALPAFPLQPTQPFYPNATGSHIYPNHYQSQVNGGAAVATHSGDDGGGVATYAGQPGCDPATLTGVSCESIGITGEVPSGLYSFTLHAFPDTGTTFDPTNFDITVRATGNMVLTANSVATATPNSTSEVLIDPDTGVIRQVGTYQGTNNTTSRLDVFALNVGHAGHVGGVTIPQIGSYLDTQGVQRWYPANPQNVDVSLPDQIAMQFQQRDVLVDQYQEEARAELQRRYEAEQRRLARLREERLQAQRELEQRELNVIAVTTATPDNCVSSSAFYTHSYDVFGCNTVQSQQVGQETDVWDFDTFETANTTTTYIIGNEADTSAGTLVDGSHNFEVREDTQERSSAQNVGLLRQSRNDEYERNTEIGAEQAYLCMYSEGIVQQAGGCAGALYQALVRTSMHVGDFFIIDAVLTAEDCLINGGWVNCGSTALEVVPVGKVVKVVKKADGVFEAVVENSDDVVDFVDDKIDDLEIYNNINTTGTVWDDVEATADFLPNTSIPATFTITSGGQRFWVNSNATKHMQEYLRASGNPLASQAMLTSFQAAVTDVVNSGSLKMGELIKVGDWELKFAQSARDEFPVIIHALYK
jgi:hypothetical protein